MSRNVLLLKTEELKARTSIHTNVDDKLLFGEIKKAQDQHIEPVLGSALYARLQDGVAANDLTTDERNLREGYIIDVLIQFVQSSLPVGMSFQTYNIGLARRTAESTDLPSMSELLALSQKFANDGEWYKQRLINYLTNNRDTFELYAYDSDNDLNPDRNAFELNIDLDEDRYHSCSDDY